MINAERTASDRNPGHLMCLVFLIVSLLFCASTDLQAESPAVEEVEGQPLAANVKRLISALEYLGAALPASLVQKLNTACDQRDAATIQKLLDSEVLCLVSLNPEVRTKVARGPVVAVLQQGGFTPFVVKVVNQSTVTRQLQISSPQAGPVYSGAALNSLKRQAQPELNRNENKAGATDRFLEVELFQASPMTVKLSGLEVEYVLALIYCHESGKREATLAFDVGAGTQDLGFRGEVPVLFDVRPAVPVKLSILDFDGKPTAARLLFRDSQKRVYPLQAKRLAPDFFFQPQIYRQDGDTVMLPAGELEMEYSRGPEYQRLTRKVKISAEEEQTLEVNLKRWVNPRAFGFYSGDHHIHAAGCAHYDNPTKGVTPQDMFNQVKGEGLNVGCVLTWGPCFDVQRRFFASTADRVSEPLTLLKYDLEISGFGSAALGHVCLLNLQNQTYPGTLGTTTGWPSWTVPVLRWCKEQGGVTGFPHSALRVNPPLAAQRLIRELDQDKSKTLNPVEAAAGLLPAAFPVIDADGNRQLTLDELTRALEQAADQLPNLAVPEMNGGGAMEICVSTAEGVCDFISAMDTERIPEWNTWYHILNCGFPLKVSGETDFPCMSSRRVGQGRVYVQLGQQSEVDFTQWCQGIRQGRSYVSDGYAHALEFLVNDVAPGFEDIQLEQPGKVKITAKVAFAPETPRAVAYGLLDPPEGRRAAGDTRVLHAPRNSEYVTAGKRLVEIVVNGNVVGQQTVPADGKIHSLQFDVPVEKSSWIALRQFPQLHTNPVNVIVADQPIRASRESALWCAETIKLLWKNRHLKIAESERKTAGQTYQRAIQTYFQRAEAAVN
ncbi:CehA/McbA family metallohydrolase [Gimesia maris]|uniref:CehA/McbA family metallohydrolase n=1 Tax=Gimesia maris TaxID=122 RepID=UPI003A925E9A